MKKILSELLEIVTIRRHSHTTRDKGMCAMELVAYIAGEPHSDHPKCVGNFIGTFVRALNDLLDEEPRQTLKPYLPRLVGTQETPETAQKRLAITNAWIAKTCRRHLPDLDEHFYYMSSIPMVASNFSPDTYYSPLSAADLAVSVAARSAALHLDEGLELLDELIRVTEDSSTPVATIHMKKQHPNGIASHTTSIEIHNNSLKVER